MYKYNEDKEKIYSALVKISLEDIANQENWHAKKTVRNNGETEFYDVFYANGNFMACFCYKNNKLNGPFEGYGYQQVWGNFKNGNFDGECLLPDRQGNMVLYDYKDGKIVSSKKQDCDAYIHRDEDYQYVQNVTEEARTDINRNLNEMLSEYMGIQTSFCCDVKVDENGEILDGTVNIRDEQNRLRGKLTIKDNSLNGPFVMLYEDGDVMFECNCKDGVLHGTFKAYDEGHLHYSTEYVDGKIKGLMEERLYYEDGDLYAKIRYNENGDIHGGYEFYYPTWLASPFPKGSPLLLMVKGNYKNGEPDGLQTVYDEKQQVVEYHLYREGQEITNENWLKNHKPDVNKDDSVYKKTSNPYAKQLIDIVMNNINSR